MKQSLRSLLEHLIDYAGLFPPAGLAMETVVSNYASYLAGPHQWLLGRLVVPIARLDEFVAAARNIIPVSAWPLTVLTGKDAESDFRAIESFNERNAGRFAIEAAEVKISDLSEIARFAAVAPEGIEVYFEGGSDDLEPFISAVSEAGMRAKIRSGGITPEAIPEAAAIAKFVELCSDQDVPFKATAGLHHPVRCVRPLTYERDAAQATMHGFVNLFLASALLYDGAIDAHHAEQILLDASAGDFSFDDQLAHWRTAEIDIDSIEAVRHNFAISFGSCSFDEPIDDLRALGWM